MLANLLQFLHIAPLAVIALALVSFLMLRARGTAMQTDSLLGILVTSCAVGILSGSALHHDAVIHMFDPCIGYSFSLLGVAVAMFKRKNVVKSIV